MTHFPVNIPELKKQAKKFVNSGASYKHNVYGPSIENYIKDEFPLYYNYLIQSATLFEYITFYCFKAALYEKSYKYESNDQFALQDFEANELAYADIYAEISYEALNYKSICETR